jgi:hypothetical protein
MVYVHIDALQKKRRAEMAATTEPCYLSVAPIVRKNAQGRTPDVITVIIGEFT